MLPILLSSQWEYDLAQGLAFALGRHCCLVKEIKKTDIDRKKDESEKHIGSLFHMLPNLHSSVERGIIAGGGKKSKTAPINVMKMTVLSEQNARAMNALRLATSGNGIPGRVVVVEGQSQGTLITVFHDGKIISSLDVAVTVEEEAVQKALTAETVGILFLGLIVDEMALCWPEGVTGDGQPLKIVTAKTLVHRKIETETVKKGLLFKKMETVSSETDTPFRLLVGASPDLAVMAFRRIETKSGRKRKPGLDRYFGGPFVFVGQCCVRVVDGSGGYFRFDFATEKRLDWKLLAPRILNLAAGRAYDDDALL